MLYTLIEHKSDIWYKSPQCPVKDLILYIEETGKLRDAQLDCLKTFLFLKLACGNKPLWRLMFEGAFNTLNLDETRLTTSARKYLSAHPEARSLYEYALSKNDLKQPLSMDLARLIENNPEAIDYESVFKQLFGDVSYADYIFSIPMGAGKTWLMAMFIYLNLYFAVNEPDNTVFAHNFAILAPAGLKSSIIPSLKDMQEFDPSFIFPPDTAKQLKRLITYEILEDSNSAKGSNIVKNPNAVRVQSHQPFDDLKGLVLITNVEKLYDKLDKSEKLPAYFDTLPEEERKKWVDVKLANELREIIGKLPNLCIMIDEVQHAKDENLRIVQVVNQWVEEADFNSVLGFSGTPYFTKPDTITVADSLKIKMEMFGNVVSYYPLADAVGNFLKIPAIHYHPGSGLDIVNSGVREFFDRYKNTVYPKVGAAKLAIYCGLIEKLEEEIYPLVCSICMDYGLKPEDVVLRYYGGTNKKGYKCAPTAQSDFRGLDSSFSKYRIVLLAQIGKEGWNCKSLTGVILPNEKSSAKNMVLQTSCRCLREVDKAADETALIWASEDNYIQIDKELKKNHHSSIAQITKPKTQTKEVVRHSRHDIVNLPLLHYFQFRVRYNTVDVADNDEETRLRSVKPVRIEKQAVTETDFSGGSRIIGLVEKYEGPSPVTFFQWLNTIVKESFGLITLRQLLAFKSILKVLFEEVTFADNDIVYLSPDFKQQTLRSDIRKCFTAKSAIKCIEESVPQEASLLKIKPLCQPYFPSADRIVYPSASEVDNIIEGDKSAVVPEDILDAVSKLRAMGNNVAADALEKPYKNVGLNNLRTYQYIPYTFDSGLEMSYYSQILSPMLASFSDVEIYFNGDETLTDFHIDCYSHSRGAWVRIGNYTPDFIILRRNAENTITKVIIVETKGTPYEASFAPKKEFMDKFIQINKDAGNITRFDFLYIPESLSQAERFNETKQHIENFLNS